MDETESRPSGQRPLGDKGEAISREDLAALIERIKLGEVELFLELIQPYERILWAVCYSVLQNDADAEEVVQETLLKAWRHLGQLENCQCFKGWLLQIAFNEARRRLREQRLYMSMTEEPSGAEADQEEFAPVDFADWRDIPSLTLEREELRAAVNRALLSLDGIYREVFVLRDMQDFTISQTAMVLGLSEACVMTRLHRARLQMREQLAPFCKRPATGWVPLRAAIDDANRYMRKVMRCERLIRQLSEYRDGNLDPQKRRKIERHLRRCRNCAVLLDSIRKLLYIIGDDEVFVPPFPCSRERWDELLSRISETNRSTNEPEPDHSPPE